MNPGNCWRVSLCLLVSAVLHLLGIWLVHLLIFRQVEPSLYRVRVNPEILLLPERFQPRPAVPLPRELLARLQSDDTPAYPEIGIANDVAGTLPGIEIPLRLDERTPLSTAGVKGKWQPLADSLWKVPLDRLAQTEEQPSIPDLVELDAEARRRTIVLIDPESEKLKQAYLHLPAYTNYHIGNPFPPCCMAWHGGKEITEALNLLERGNRLPQKVPISSEVRYYELGSCGCPSPDLDPIHRFALFPRRHILRFPEMKEYPVLLLRYIDVESTAALARYLLEGGFAVADRGQLHLLEREVRSLAGDRLQQISIGREHPLFHIYFDISRYSEENKGCARFFFWASPSSPCPAVKPLPGLKLDDRLIAVVGPPFNRECPCPANKLYVNVLVYALTQPGPMGGRYMVGVK